jgi:hypothetical protein
MIDVKIVGLVGKRMEGGVGLGLQCGGWLYRSEGRQTPPELDRKSGKGGACARIGEWMGCLEDGLHVDWDPGGYTSTRVRRA